MARAANAHPPRAVVLAHAAAHGTLLEARGQPAVRSARHAHDVALRGTRHRGTLPARQLGVARRERRQLAVVAGSAEGVVVEAVAYCAFTT
ncbi:MAG: hypothetical protein M3R38_04190 [Actinomycetota bacterium]|nr:hypothetical protein [Actinomycetota bacterium]